MVQRQVGNFLADHAARADRRARGWRRGSQRGFAAMMEMGKIDVAAIEAAGGAAEGPDSLQAPT